MERLLSKLIVLLILGSVVLLESCNSSPVPSWNITAENLDEDLSWQLDFFGEDESKGKVRLWGNLTGGHSYMEGEAFLQEDGSWLIHWDYLNWFHNHSNGWTEGQFALWGTLRLKEVNQQWVIEVEETPWIEGIEMGKIRFKDNIISGENGQDQLRRRWDRIETLTPLLQENLDQDHYIDLEKARNNPTFSDEMGTFFFPERFGYTEGMEAGSDFVKAEGIHWDKEYSKQILPEEWVELRDSGTLFRDYEEALPLFWLSYNWNWLWEEAIPSQSFEIHYQ